MTPYWAFVLGWTGGAIVGVASWEFGIWYWSNRWST